MEKKIKGREITSTNPILKFWLPQGPQGTMQERQEKAGKGCLGVRRRCRSVGALLWEEERWVK
uniref:Uncharacterized protein n=1 Tax=Arundo donax TaxID=35708 RepID=A0A0A9FIV2_ARUDO